MATALGFFLVGFVAGSLGGFDLRGAVSGLFAGGPTSDAEGGGPGPDRAADDARAGEEPSPAGKSSAPAEPPPANGARVAIVVDDLGRSLEELDRLADLGVPLTYSVLPFESRTGAVVEALAARGAEVLCHLPMEPRNGADPGPGALTRDMSYRRMARATREALGAVPGAVGVNNHMGSGISSDRRAMRAILGVIERRDLFFLDSRTSSESVAFTTALELGLAAAERQVFLDNDRSPEAVRRQFLALLTRASQRGRAIAIGHPYPETLAVLRDELPRARALGYEFVPVSRLVVRP